MTQQLFQPIRVGAHTLRHRVVLAPLTRMRATEKGAIPIVPLVKEYYAQRGSQPGTLLITEGTFIALQAGGYDNVPGIWSDQQIAAWKEITHAVHEKGSFIFLQLWALGRGATLKTLQEDGVPYIAPSAVGFQAKDSPIPRALTLLEIQEYIELYAKAAANAIEAGFDGVEIHGANGYLVDQFLQDVTNKRTDDYGGSIENRSRFGLDVVQAVVNAVGEERTAIRFSPWGTFLEMRMENPIPQYTHFIESLKSRFPKLAYLHLVEPDFTRAQPSSTVAPSNDFIRLIWSPKPLITTGCYVRETAIQRAENYPNELIGFGKLFISNPDLPIRLQKDIPLTPFNTRTFYTPGHRPGTEIGYIDYPFSPVEEEQELSQVNSRM